MRQYCLAICEIYTDKRYGIPSNDMLHSHYMVHYVLSLDEFYDDDELSEMCEQFHELNTDAGVLDDTYKHPIIRNYKRIIQTQPFVELIVLEELPTGEQVAYIHTHLIKRIQLKWKSIYRSRQETIRKLKRWGTLRLREMTGGVKKLRIY